MANSLLLGAARHRATETGGISKMLHSLAQQWHDTATTTGAANATSVVVRCIAALSDLMTRIRHCQ